MKTKILIIGSLILLLVFGFLYTQKSYLIADDKDGKDKKDCSSSCTKQSVGKNNVRDHVMSGANATDNKDGYAVYEFVTDKIHCDACKSGMSENLMGMQGVKEVSYGETKDTHTTVKVSFLESETTSEVIAASVKEKGLQGNCSDGSKCTMKKTEKKL